MAEQWTPVPSHEDTYEVSDQGRVRNWRTGRVLVPTPNWAGYLCVRLAKDGKPHAHRVHRLVLTAFVGPCPDGMETRHLNGDRADNRLVNLAWSTHSANMRDLRRHGTHHLGNKEACKRGHALSGANLSEWALRKGWRACKACDRGKLSVRRWGKRGRQLDLQTVSDEHYSVLMRMETT
jgi:hypothetical protein